MRSTMRRSAGVVALLSLVLLGALAQQPERISLSGTVFDDSSGEPLENVNVFVAQTTLGANTDRSGHFEILHIPSGAYTLVASRLGYSMLSVQMMLSSETGPVNFRLKPAVIPIGEVVVSAAQDDEWPEHLEKFRKLFLGTTPNADECRILNPEILDFDENDDAFYATARAPLEVQNDALGYRFTYLLNVFRVGKATPDLAAANMPNGKVLVFEGWPKYEQLEPSSAEQGARWKQHRLDAFEGSLRHFLISIFNGTWEKEGYIINQMPQFNVLDTPIGRMRIKEDNIGSILSDNAHKGVKRLEYEGLLEVEYTKKRIDPAFDLIRKQGTNAQVSWMRLNQGPATLTPMGLMMEKFPTMSYGYWAWLRFADMLPLDYKPGD